jgi:hypothetical protein
MSQILSPSAPGPLDAGYAQNRYYFGLGENGSNSGLAVTANRLYAAPFVCVSPQTFTRLGVECSSGSGNGRLGIYKIKNGVPTDLIVDGGNFSVSGAELESTIAQNLAPGTYALAGVFSSNPTLYSKNNNDFLASILGESVPDVAALPHLGWYVSHTFGALPSTFGSPTYADINTPVPNFWLRNV